ncbi:MAG: hypothetical protein HKP58_00515 [Desulfatitalea sp.]|nr:hypothetical protein [Desulfatitalea sp.]
MIYNVSNLWSKVSWAPKVTKMPKKEEYEVSEANALKAKANSCYKMVTDGVGGCWFAASLGIQNWPVFDWLNAATGWHRSADAYMEIGERIQTLRQMFNIKHGIHPMDFKITDRLAGHPPLENGPLAEKAFDIEGMMKMYWTVFGWDSDTGDPTHSAKRMLGGINLD